MAGEAKGFAKLLQRMGITVAPAGAPVQTAAPVQSNQTAAEAGAVPGQGKGKKLGIFRIFERMGLTIQPPTPLPAGKGPITASTPESQQDKKVSKEHLFYGNDGVVSPTDVSIQQARKRAIQENVLRHSTELYPKEERFTYMDEEF